MQRGIGVASGMISTDHRITLVAITTETGDLPSQIPNLDGLPVEYCPLPEIWDWLDHEVPDVIIAPLWAELQAGLFTALHDTFTIQQRPAIILFADTMPQDDHAALADAILPCINHPLIAHQIRQVVEQKNHMAELQGRVTALEVTNRDLRRSQAANQHRSLDEVEVLKNIIVTNVTHEISTPLLQVKAAVAMLAEDAKKNTLVDYAQRATARLEGVVKNITQLAASIDDLRLSPMIVREGIDAALRDLRRTWEYKEHISRVHVDVEDNLPLAYADRQGITTVLQQLIDNALKFSQGTIEVSAHLHHNHIVIRVRDYGIGIAPEHLDKIFDSFYQADSSSRRSYGGTGVGLAVVRLILDRHGVDIQVESVVNEGSTFSFALPITHLHA